MLDNCVAQVDPIIPGQKASAVTEMGCFATFAEAIAAATAGTVSLSLDVTPDSITESDIAPAIAAIIGIDYDRRSYRGRSYTWTGGPNGCYSSSYIANMPGHFNNRLTSTRGFSGCYRNTSYSGFFQSGYWVRCFPNCTYIGGFLNNATSSKHWAR